MVQRYFRLAELRTLTERVKKMGIICPSCHHENLTRGRFCNDCGELIWLECPRCQESYPAGAQFCSHCKYPVQVAPASEKCPSCDGMISADMTHCDRCKISLIDTKPPRLEVAPVRLDFGRVCVEKHREQGDNWRDYDKYTARYPGRSRKELGEHVKPLDLLIANIGERRLKVIISRLCDWLLCPYEGGIFGNNIPTSIGGGGSRRYQIKLTARYLRKGQNSGTITITSNGGNATIPVTVEVV